MATILIVDDHAFLRESLGFQLLRENEKVEIIEAADAEAAIIELKQHRKIDLVLLDLALPGMDGIDCLKHIRKINPKVYVAIFSAYDDLATINRVKAGGASGFISKRCSGEALLCAIKEITEGNGHWPKTEEMGDDFASSEINRTGTAISGVSVQAKDYGLTDRQHAVLELVVAGLSNREISEQLGIKEGTIKIHLCAAFKCLGVNSRTQAVAVVQRFKIKPPKKTA